ncbi:hypothetical protein NX801_08305 [Streptomyces sp. LP05-1]|uniref:Uncharacterized protein n=1 Tax=Streptomyces pyxinae TaxID=2970734 RepID=A0ABT2CE24_9ACTN|nr:hypothetical protein [Streptomyces sp. LP05-1]MCS0635665.1 hypothetical protein [Streptomyces sp. LP05-1]
MRSVFRAGDGGGSLPGVAAVAGWQKNGATTIAGQYRAQFAR